MNIEATNFFTHIYPYIDTALGGVFVLFYAATRFNTPATNRSSTTALRYFVGLFLYCVTGIGFYAFLVSFPSLLDFFMYGHTIPSDPVTSKISLPLFVALLLTVLLPKVPFLSTADNWIFEQLKHMAAIPWEVQRLSSEMSKDKMEISADEETMIRQELEDDGFDPNDILFETIKPSVNKTMASKSVVASSWTHLTALLHKVDDWKSDRRMAGYVACSEKELEKLRERHQRLFSKAKTCFRLMNEDVEGGGLGKTHGAMLSYKEDFMERVTQLREDTLTYIAHGVLHAELTGDSRERRLKALGFSINWPDPPFSLNQLMLLFGLVCMVMLSGFVLFKDNLDNVPVEAMLTRSIMISVIYSVAVACAVFPKARWNFARAQADDVRPIAFYLLAGLMATGISQITSVTFNLIMLGRFDWAWQRFQITYPWLLISFFTAFITGIMVDNPQIRGLSAFKQRCLEALAQGVAMLGVAFVTYFWLWQRWETASKICDLRYLKCKPPAMTIIVMAGMVGFVIGFFIPTWYRRHNIESEERARRPVLVDVIATSPRQSVISC
jgi:hypothetical protein